MIRRSTLFAYGVFLLLPAVTFAQTWTGAGAGTTWEEAANWDSDPALPTGNVFIGDTAVVELSTSQTIAELEIVGDNTVGTAVVNHTGGALTTAGWSKVGIDAGNDGTLNVSGTASHAGATRLFVGRFGVGEVNFSDSATGSYTQAIELGTDAGGDGTLNLSGTSIVSTTDAANLGNNGGAGTINISDGATLNVDTFNTTNGGTGTAVINMDGGTLNSNQWIAIGVGAAGATTTFNHSGGTVNQGITNTAEFITIGENTAGTYNASGTADINATGVLVGRNFDVVNGNAGDGLLVMDGSTITFDTGDLRLGLTASSADAGASGEISWIADAAGVSTIVSTDNTEFGANAALTVDLTADAAFSTWTSTPTGALVDIAVLVDNAASVVGTFTGLTEGASVAIGGGQTAFITYVGGDGNDIILQAYSTGVTELKGDVDLDGDVDFDDIPAFITVLQSGVFLPQADCDCSTVIDFEDIPAFILILQNQ